MTAKQKQFKKEHNLIKSPWLKNKLITAGIYLVGLFVILLVNYLGMLGFHASIWVWLDILLMIFFVAPIFFFKGIIFDCIYLPCIMLLVTIFLIINLNYYRVVGVVFTIKDFRMAFENIGQAGEHMSELNWPMTITDVALFCIFAAGILVFNIKFRFKETRTHKNPTRKVMNILAGSVLGASLLTYEFSLGMWTISEKNRQVESIKFVNNNSNYHFRNLGMISFYNKEIRQLLFDKGASEKEVIAYLQNPELVQDNYTNLLNKPNIFVVLIETGDEMMLNQYTTPNLWKLFKQEGIYADNNYSYNHTNITNMSTINGNIPAKELIYTNQYTMPFNLPNILKNEGYNTRFYFDTVKEEETYHDMSFIPSMGFENCFWHNDLIPDVQPWSYKRHDYTRDSIVVDGILKNLKKYLESSSKPFYSQWMSMHMHMSQVITEGNKSMIEGLYKEYGPKLKQYESEGKWHNPCQGDDAKSRYEIFALKTMDFDKALGELMDYFYGSEDPYLNNTLMVAFGDHISYEVGSDKWLTKWAKGIDDGDNLALYKTVLGFYHPELKTKIEADETGLFNGHNLQKQTSPACIVPTVLDLLGIKYNNKIYTEQSAFDLNNQTTYDSSYDDIYYSAIINVFMDKNYTSDNGGYVSKVIHDVGKQDEFIKKVWAKQKQLRIIDYIYHHHFFKDHNYEDYLPTEFNKFLNTSKEFKIVKYYE